MTGCSCWMDARTGPSHDCKGGEKAGIPCCSFVTKERLTQMSETGRHQGVIAYAAAYEYAEVEDMLGISPKAGGGSVPFPAGQY